MAKQEKKKLSGSLTNNILIESLKLNKCYYLDRLSGKMDRGSVKDKLLLVCGSREGGAGGAAPWPPSSVFTSNELLNPDKNGLKLPPKAATTAAYCRNNALHHWVCIRK